MDEGVVVRVELPLPGDRVAAAAASPIPSGAERAGAVVIVRDITLEKQIDRMKTELTQTVSHELRTPLTSILGFTKLIKSRLARVLPHIDEEDARVGKAAGQLGANIDIVIAESERLSALVTDVLDVAKMESGSMHWDMQPVEPAELAEWTRQATAGLFVETPVVFQAEVASDLPALQGDRRWLQQVLLNLVSNAAKFTEQGAVTLEVLRVPDGVEFAVRDEGPGIPREAQSRIFERFQQVRGATGKSRGTGLGLPICRQVVSAHGGEIRVESDVGRGARFAFVLPVPPPA
jgi:signal transduction histidine kinase